MTAILFQAHTLSRLWRYERPLAFLILGNPSLVLKSPPDVQPSTPQPRPTTHVLRHVTSYVTCSWRCFSLQVQTNPNILRDRQGG